MVIAGPELRLRYATPQDAPRLFELARDPEVTRFFSWGPYERLKQAEDYVASLPVRRTRGELLDFVVEHPREGVLGVTGLSELAVRDRRATIGSWLGRAAWGTGVNAQAKALVFALAFGTLGLERLTAYAAPGNPRSVAALRKVGFTEEGTLRAYHRHGERVHDVKVFGLLRREWRPAPGIRVRGDPPPGWLVAASGSAPAA